MQGEQEQHDPSSPPLATPLYRPAPVVTPKRQSNDFEDLPDQEIRIPDDEEWHQEPATTAKSGGGSFGKLD